MRRPSARRAAPLAACAALLGAAGAAERLATAEQVQACVEANQPRLSSVARVSLLTRDAMGPLPEKRGRISWQRLPDGLSRLVIHFSAPAEMRGAALLVLERADRDASDLFMYLPELDRVRRISRHMATSAVFGTDLSYEQLERLHGMFRDAAVELEADDVLAGRDVYVMTGRPRPGPEGADERSRVFVDRATCVPLRIEVYEEGELSRLLEVAPADLDRVGPLHVAKRLVARDLRRGTQTELRIESLEVDVEIPAEVFTTRELQRRRLDRGRPRRPRRVHGASRRARGYGRAAAAEVARGSRARRRRSAPIARSTTT